MNERRSQQAAEIERLKRERDEWRHRYSRRTEAYDDAEHRLTCGLAELSTLKAKQVAEAEEAMRLADEYAGAKSDELLELAHGCRTDFRERCKAEVVRTREALHAALTKDRG